MQALVRFSHIAAASTFSPREMHGDTAQALGLSITAYSLGSLRYDLSKLRAQGLVEKLPKSRRYQLTADGYRICLVYLKLFEKIYAPLTAAILAPFRDDNRVLESSTTKLDRLYRAVVRALDQLAEAVGIKAA